MAKIHVEHGGELQATEGLGYPDLAVRFSTAIRRYEIIRYRDRRRVNSDIVGVSYQNAAGANARMRQLQEEFATRRPTNAGA